MFNDLCWNLTYYSRLALCIIKLNIVYILNLFSIHVTYSDVDNYTRKSVSMYHCMSVIYWQYNVTIVSVRSIDYSYKSRPYTDRQCFLFF